MSKVKKKAAKPAAKKPVTALARVVKAPKVTIHDPSGLLPQSTSAPIGQLGELATVGALGLSVLRLNADEKAVLMRPPNVADIRTKPGKRGPIAYLPHIVYTRWFNEAFGIGEWAVVPVAKAAMANKLMMIPYMLYVRGLPIAYAMGEQDYFDNNDQQSYGDAIESTVASALRRFAKRLGVGLEMWDKEWLEANVRPQRGQRQAPIQREEFIDAEPEAVIDDAPDYITRQQLDRFAEIAERMGRQPAEVSLWLKKKWGVKRASHLLKKDYAQACRELEQRGDLVIPGDGD